MLTQNCECIKVTYTLVGEEPVTVEVEKDGEEYTIEDIGTIEKVGDEWLVISGGACDDCVKVSFTYLGVNYNYSVPKTGTANGKNLYYLQLGLVSFIRVVWDGLKWGFRYTLNNGSYSTYFNNTNVDCPIFNSWTYDDEEFEIVSLITSSCQSTQATLSEDTPCPFGTYTIEEGSPFSAFEVEPCTIPNPYVESINCYKLAVWSKQCEYSKCVLEYVNNLIFGIDVCKLEESLKEQRRVLEILNCYDPRDILNNTVIYNTIPYGTIKKLLYK